MRFILFSLVCVFLAAGCSTRKAPEVYAEGLAAEKGGNTALALEKYEELVRDFSSEAVAETAMYKIVMLRGNNPTDKDAAIAAERRYLELYPESERAPTVMFMMAFLYNNELHEIDSARAWYTLFLSKYPGHELAASAKFELETLGEAPDDLLRKGEGGGAATGDGAKNDAAHP